MGLNIPKDPEKMKKESKSIFNQFIIVNKNHFEFLYIIGRGGFGRVWKVKLKSTNEYFAAKVMLKTKIISHHSEDNIISEKNILSKLNNPFIVNMYFSFQDNDNLYLLLDLLSGGDLRYHLSHKRPSVFNEIQTKFFISNIILALEYIHSQKIIHRDIKPENLVLDISGYVRLTDFGIAIINKNDNSKESSGTAGYMAPEVMLQQGHSYPADFFALGVIGYEFMIGNRPYYGRNRRQIKNFILSYQAKIKFNNMKKGWSENSKDFINKLLQRRPVKRLGYGGIKDLKNHLWLKDIDWDLLKKKKIRAPYIPKEGKEYFDKKYCEEEKTIEKYKNLIDIKEKEHVFDNYTFININYIEKLYNNKNNQINNSHENEFNNTSLKQISFSESLSKVKSFSSSKDNSHSIFKINRNFLSANKLRKNFNGTKNFASCKSKDNLYNSSRNQLYKYYKIGGHKEKDKKEKEIIINKMKIMNRHCFSSDNIIIEKKELKLNLKELHRLIEKSVINSPLFKGDITTNNNSKKKMKDFINYKFCKSTKSILNKSKTSKNIFREKKNTIEKEKEKELLLNSTTKEKTTKEKTTENKEKKVIKKINKKVKINNNKKVVKNEESKYSTNYKKNKIRESFINNEYFNSTELNNYKIHSRNKLKREVNTKAKDYSKIKMSNNKGKESNNEDYHIKVIHKKVYQVRNNKNKEIINHKLIKNNYSLSKNYSINKNDKNYTISKNISIIKNNSMNNYMTINSQSNPKNHIKSAKNISRLKKNKKFDGTKSNKQFNSKGFIEFRKKQIKINHEKMKKEKVTSKEKELVEKDKKINDLNNKNLLDGKVGALKFGDYFSNTVVDKELSKNNYYILDKFVSI